MAELQRRLRCVLWTKWSSRGEGKPVKSPRNCTVYDQAGSNKKIIQRSSDVHIDVVIDTSIAQHSQKMLINNFKENADQSQLIGLPSHAV